MLLFYIDSIYWTWFHSCVSVNKENLWWSICCEDGGMGDFKNGGNPWNKGEGGGWILRMEGIHEVGGLIHLYRLCLKICSSENLLERLNYFYL